MASPLFGWSAQDVFTLIRICDSFFTAYGEGPGGALPYLKNFRVQVEDCQRILKLVQCELEDGELFYDQLKRDSLKDTLEQCVKVFEKSEFLKQEGHQGRVSKAVATFKYMWSDEGHIQKLSGILHVHISYINAFLQILQMFVSDSP